MGWGAVPAIEVAIGTDPEEAPIPSDVDLVRETWSLMRRVQVPPTWSSLQVCRWLADVEEKPEDWPEETPWAVEYSNLQTQQCVLVEPPVKWIGWTEELSAPPESERGEENTVHRRGSKDDDVSGISLGKRKFNSNPAVYNKLLSKERVGKRLQDSKTRDMLGASLTSNSWKALGSLHTKIEECRKETGKRLQLPWVESDWISFTSYISDKMAASSVKATVGRLATLHGVLGHSYKRPEFVSRMLQGLANSQLLQRQSKVKRKEMSTSLLKELRQNLKKQKWPLNIKRAAWCLSLWMFYGKSLQSS